MWRCSCKSLFLKCPHIVAAAVTLKAIGESLTAITLQNLGLLAMVRGDRRALELSRRTKGDRHPATALSLQRLGQLEIDRGQLVSAEEHLLEARTIREALNPTAPELSDVQFELGRLELARGRPMDAVPWLESAVQLRLQPGVPAYHLGEAEHLLDRALAPVDSARSRRLALE